MVSKSGNWSDRIGRGRFLGLSGMSVAAIAMASAGLSESKAIARPVFQEDPFGLGVASGDPLPGGVVLWTRLAPEPGSEDGRGGMPDRKVPVRWEVAEDEGFRKVVSRGTEVATPELGHSVHAEVEGLRPFREYYYRFKVGGETSPVGRTKTAPEPGAALDSLSFALGSCQAWVGGRYAAYRDMAEQDLDLVLHVGDYIYEGADTRSLSDFRNLHALYKTSPDLQAAHAAFPFVVAFDDHEVDNNWADDAPQDDTPNFLQLRANAFQAYYEHMPLRMRQRPKGPDMLLYRRLAYGRLAEFNVLDTRQYRDDQLSDAFPGGPQQPGVFDPSRTFTGREQERWLLRNLDRSEARWNVLTQQTMMAQYDYDTGEGVSVNHDQWDGYAAQRDRLLGFIGRRRLSNPMVLTGDWHVSMVNDVRSDFSDPDSEVVATEFLGDSISSGAGWAADMEAARDENPHVRFLEGTLKGYLLSTVTPDEWRSDFRVVADPADPASPARTLSSWVVEDGTPGAQRV